MSGMFKFHKNLPTIAVTVGNVVGTFIIIARLIVLIRERDVADKVVEKIRTQFFLF